jgi:Type II secretion system (T2SS), protein E, N-terminal domain
MPLLSVDKRSAVPQNRQGSPAGRSGLLEPCANSGCGSGWLHLWRSRSVPVFEGGWNCSPACTEERLRAAVRRELEGRTGSAPAYRHRLPLGLLMMEKGWITSAQLKRALEAQKAAGAGRLGQYLVRQQAASEQLITRALSLQWSCPVLSAAFQDRETLAALLPRLFIDAFGALPLRMAAGKILYLGFEERLDAVLALALERMSGLRVESGLVHSSEFGPAQERMLGAGFPPVQLLEAVSEPALVKALARAVERTRPVESRLVRVHDCLWLRMWKKTPSGPVGDIHAVEDVIGSIGE